MTPEQEKMVLVAYNPHTNTIALATDDCWEAWVIIGEL